MALRQTIRLNEVRAPGASDDGLAPSAVTAIDDTAVTFEDYNSAVITQIRNLLGEVSWKALPQASVAALKQSQAQVSQNVAAQVATIAAHDQALANQANSIQALGHQLSDLLALKAQVAGIQDALASLSSIYVSQTTFDQLATDVAALQTGLQQQVASVQAQLGQALTSLAAQNARLQAVESNQANFVTAQGLHNVLAMAFVVDERMVGTLDGQNTYFATSRPFAQSTLQVRYNGQSLLMGQDADYVVVPGIDGVPSNAIRLEHAEAAPHSQDVLTATYLPATLV